MTKEHEASRRLVKSPPELWAECSDPSSLARHLGEFGEIKITRVEPETAVAWEGERASGTIRIEASGWGTRVTLTALTETTAEEMTAVADEVSQPQPAEEESDATAQETLEEPGFVLADAGRFRSRWRRMTGRMRAFLTGPDADEVAVGEASAGLAEAHPDPQAGSEGPPEQLEEPVPQQLDEAPPDQLEEAPPREPELDPESILVAALDSLGQAHHRPFSRA